MGSSSILQIIVVLAIILWGGWGIFKGVKLLVRTGKTKNWPTTSGRINETNIAVRHTSRRSNGNTYHSTRYEPMVNYEYQVGGVTYSGVKIQEIGRSYGKSKADEIAANYPVGGLVTVYYDPESPGDAVLVPGGGNLALGEIIGGVFFVVVGLVIGYVLFMI